MMQIWDGVKQVKKVALLIGGWSAERDVSLEKGPAVEQALRAAEYDVQVIDVQKDAHGLIEALRSFGPDVVFNNLYGEGGEDGVVQGVLEMLGLAYTHSNVMASAIAMDKAMSKNLAALCGVPAPKGAVMPMAAVAGQRDIAKPYVVKPVDQGSSVGVYIVDDHNDIPQDVIENWQYGDVLVEQYIPGRELTVAILDGKAQAVTEIISQAPFFNYAAKYSDQATQYVLPAKIPEDIYNKALDYAQQIFKMIGCQGLARCDFRFNETNQGEQGLFFLEINTQPGLTAQSIGPSQVVYNGMSFPMLCSYLVETAFSRSSKLGAIITAPQNNNLCDTQEKQMAKAE